MRFLYVGCLAACIALVVSCSGDSNSNGDDDAGAAGDASVPPSNGGTGAVAGAGGAMSGGVAGTGGAMTGGVAGTGGAMTGGTSGDAGTPDAADASMDGSSDASVGADGSTDASVADAMTAQDASEDAAGSGGTGGTAGTGGTGGGLSVCQGGAPATGAGGYPADGFPAVDPPPCSPVGSACGNGGVCFAGPAAQVLSCRTPCDPSAGDGGVQGNCAADEVCTAESGLVRYACLRRCTPFVTPSVCDPGEWCYPTPHPSFTQNVAVEGLCLAANNLTDGDPCPYGGCGLDLVCHSPDLATLGTSHCEIACDINAGLGEPGACPVGEVCDRQTGDRGGCVRLCDPFAQASTCPSGETCFPFEELEGGQRIIEGHCVKPGFSPLGSTCYQGGCASGLSCSTDPAPYNFEVAECRPLCRPSDPGSCAAGESCVPYVNFVEVDVGTCVASCTLWQTDQCAAGCATGEWCAPSYTGRASCVAPTASVPVGGSCNYHNECGAGGYCACRFQGQFDGCGIIGEAECERACDPTATLGSAGSCPTGEVCAPEWFLGEDASFGVCRSACDFDAGSGCPDPAETCVPGEILSQNVDTCYDIATPFPQPGGTCSPVDYSELEPCGPTSRCLHLPGQFVVRCEDLCRESAGAIGTQNHPDCDSPLSTCTFISAELPYGVCR